MFKNRSTISAIEFQKLIKDSPAEELRILDASYGDTEWGAARNAYLTHHIPEALFFDIDEIADPNAQLPHTIPSSSVFNEKVSSLGITNDSTIVIYDRFGIYMAAARAWWMFKYFGHKKVFVLNGGLPAWLESGGNLSSEQVPTTPSEYKSSVKESYLARQSDVKEAINNKDTIIIDARPHERFCGTATEPWPNMRSGHIPYSINIPFPTLIDTNGLLMSNKLLAPLLGTVHKNSKIISTCGSGVTACVLAMALYNVKEVIPAIYDGSWSEWGAETSEMPIAI